MRVRPEVAAHFPAVFPAQLLDAAPEPEGLVFGQINPDYWTNINFITSTVTTLFGVWTGLLLQSRKPHGYKMQVIGI